MEKSSSDYLRSIDENIAVIRENIHAAALRSGRSAEDITLMAVTKTVAPDFINYALSRGIKCIGENRVQELNSKINQLNLDGVSVHLIGHLQTNKVRQVIDQVDMIESVDSLKLAREISLRATAAGIVMPVLIEVNVGAEESKSGTTLENAERLVEEISLLDGISVRGLMTIPPICEKIEQSKHYFELLHNLFIDIREKNKHNSNIEMQYLSMGMTDDYVAAIECGSNLVRIGSGIFGLRNYSN